MDFDFGASPTLFAEGDGTKLVGAGHKDGMFFVSSRDARSSGPLWKVAIAAGGDPTKGQGTIVSPAFSNGLLYVSDGALHPAATATVTAYEPKTGVARWSTSVPGYVIAPIAAVGDVLVAEVTAVNNSTSALVFLDAKTGSIVKKYPGSDATRAAPAVGHGLVPWMENSGRLHAPRMPSLLKRRPHDGVAVKGGGRNPRQHPPVQGRASL